MNDRWERTNGKDCNGSWEEKVEEQLRLILMMDSWK